MLFCVSGIFCHSFRAGWITTLAKAGVDEETCMVLGRWRSSAWKKYAKAGRGLRREELQKISELVMSSMREQETVVVEASQFGVIW